MSIASSILLYILQKEEGRMEFCSFSAFVEPRSSLFFCIRRFRCFSVSLFFSRILKVSGIVPTNPCRPFFSLLPTAGRKKKTKPRQQRVTSSPYSLFLEAQFPPLVYLISAPHAPLLPRSLLIPRSTYTKIIFSLSEGSSSGGPQKEEGVDLQLQPQPLPVLFLKHGRSW